MSVVEQVTDLSTLADRIDMLSTRLMIDGAATLRVSDFEEFATLARAVDQAAVAATADGLVKVLQSNALSREEQTHLLSSSLEQMRQACDPEKPSGDGKDAAGIAPSSASAPAPGALALDRDLIDEFIAEANDHLAAIEQQMLVLEQDSAAAEPLNTVFRGFHTIKGLAGFFEFTSIQTLTHEVETLLDLARTGQLTVTPAVVDVVLEAADVVKHELQAIEDRLAGSTGRATRVNQNLLARVRAAGATKTSDVSISSAPLAQPAVDAGKRGLEPTLETPCETDAPPQTSVSLRVQVTTITRQPGPERTPLTTSEKTASQAANDTAKPESTSVRIDTAKLDQLMDMLGEMVIAQTLIGHSPVLAALHDARLMSDLTQLARITADVQRITTGMRMVPIGAQLQKTARLIRDLSRKAGKHIVLETAGEDTELDKSLADQLSDPLLHMVRNSVDHGIETPEERSRLGKDPTACIRIAAYHQSGQIVISISDDGRGLNRDRILAKAQQNGLIHAGSALTENEIFHLIFEPGFSTAEKVTDISGRGVGMDVVRRHVQKLRGRIEIQSKAGEGTTFLIRLPLTLAIIEGLVVVVGAQRYVVPLFAVKEMFRPTPEMLSTVQGTREMVMVRGNLLPIVRLHERFNIEPRTAKLSEGTLIVGESQGRHFCLFVDELVSKQEVVIKSLGPTFKDIIGLAGCTILGDGRVGLILDFDGIYMGRA